MKFVVDLWRLSEVVFAQLRSCKSKRNIIRTKTMKSKILSALVCSSLLAVSNVFALTTFWSDDFESGSLANWTQGASALTINNTQNVVPSGGTYSAYADLSADRMYRNLGSELDGYAKLSFWLYDDTMTRPYGQALAYTGAGYNAGTLVQLFAAGKYSSVTMPGETYKATKYQGRILYPSATFGWFNLDASGSPDRSPGWHKFSVERMFNGTSINFYIDDILSRSFTGATAGTWDSISMGFGTSSSSNGNAWYDGVLLEIPEPSAFALGLLGGLGMLWMVRRRTA